MIDSKSEAYAAAGVDVTAGCRAVELMKKHVESTYTKGVLGGIGGFGGLFEPDLSGIGRPVLVSGTDGVGTKLKIAFMLDKHDTVGIDCVAMCVNDVVCSGARPLFFLDYVAVGRNSPERVASIVSGVAEGCRQAGCALIGGETAEMPGFYPPEEYDLAGFCVGLADKDKIIDGSGIRAGDSLIGIASSGLHSNGFSLVRHIFRLTSDKLDAVFESMPHNLGATLLTPTKIYVKSALRLIESAPVKGLCHITGGGFFENIPRMFPEGLRARIFKGTWPVLPVFDLLQSTGNVSERDMFNTFNMGIGMVAAVPAGSENEAISALEACGEKAYKIGTVVAGECGVELI